MINFGINSLILIGFFMPVTDYGYGNYEGGYGGGRSGGRGKGTFVY